MIDGAAHSGELMTAADLLRLDMPGKATELVRGRLIVREPAGLLHGATAMAIAASITQHVRANALGLVVAAETGFKLSSDPDTVRAPDVGFIASERVPQPLPRDFADLAPDLAVEVLSPDDRPGEVLAKVADWLRAGTRVVWVIDPKRRQARVYRDDGSELVIGAGGMLPGEDVLPGFAYAIDDLPR